jgi:hypothetical protein
VLLLQLRLAGPGVESTRRSRQAESPAPECAADRNSYSLLSLVWYLEPWTP